MSKQVLIEELASLRLDDERGTKSTREAPAC